MGSTKPCFTAAELAVSLSVYMYVYIYTSIQTHTHTHARVPMPKLDTFFLLLHITKDMSPRRGMCYVYLLKLYVLIVVKAKDVGNLAISMIYLLFLQCYVCVFVCVYTQIHIYIIIHFKDIWGNTSLNLQLNDIKDIYGTFVICHCAGIRCLLTCLKVDDMYMYVCMCSKKIIAKKLKSYVMSLNLVLRNDY